MKPDNRKNLVLTRRVGETIDIFFGEEKVSVTVLDRTVTKMGGSNVRIAILANEGVKILRAEKCPYVEKPSRVLGSCSNCDRGEATHYHLSRWFCSHCKALMEKQR